jgi:hypothetical protein
MHKSLLRLRSSVPSRHLVMEPTRAAWLSIPALLLFGCPIYPDHCSADTDCENSYYCDYPAGQCVAASASTAPGPERCNSTSDCDPGLVCDPYSRCVPPDDSGGHGGDGDVGASGSAAEGQAEGGAAG